MRKLPPRTLQKLQQLREADRKMYAYELLASYDERKEKLYIVASQMALDWVENQAAHFEEICDFLRQVIDTGDIPEE